MKEIFVERSTKVLRIIIRQEKIIKECFMKEQDQNAYPGEIYMGIVKNIVPAIKCAFIDIGCKRNAYMYIDKKFKNINLKKGDMVLGEIVKEDQGKKGAKIVKNISIPGKYCVLNSSYDGIQFSKKIHSESFKKNILESLKLPAGIGLMIRTESENIPLEVIHNEMEKLYKVYSQVMKSAAYLQKPGLLFDNGGILGEVLRDKLIDDNFIIYVNNQEDYKYVEDFLKGLHNVCVNLQLYTENKNLFAYYELENKILNLRNNKIDLKCGGYIVINRTEAMFVIDVNSGKNIKNGTMDKTVLITNLQAAEEIAAQIILRNLNGIILIDFIDMDNNKNKKKVMDKLKDGFLMDKNKTVIYPFTELNLVQIARKRMGRSINDYIEEDCGCCGGTGKKIKLSYMTLLIKNEILNMCYEENVEDIHIEMDSFYESYIKKSTKDFIKDIGAENKRVYITYGKKISCKVEALLFASDIEDFKDFRIN
ncbi:ribonuclease E/G [Clostridium kluyveri]|uniref:ribonuclease E/G n=1 Tax=Clostridium kluyveri TaxID=1534 RepID=UPI0022479665|nr:ribonuclease E/G [Clostridium kluyveri]UZQ51730.1 ribonuclease E/G [Clostridium kluyveri]